ncbi:MAG: hypothetical protein EOO48_01955 [Flavobacterium sp.]|nr:MAG: hypothetical protein EOO48_01955 [Flavobacterium sp.]
MNLEKVLAITGKPGLYELKIQTRSGFVAESLLDGKKITVGMRNNVSLLSEISMYTHSEEKPLAEVMRNIAKKENNGPAISHKEDNATLTAYFKEVLPDYDEDRVYASDIKKVLNWYNLLQAKGMVSSVDPKAEAKQPKEKAATTAEDTESNTAEAPKPKKAAAKKAKE